MLKILQAEYVEKVLKRYNMSDAKPVNVPLGGHFNLSKAQTLTTKDENVLMSEVPYKSAVGNLKYAMVCTKAKHCSSSRSRQQVFEQSWEGKLENGKVDLEISEREFRYVIVL